MHYKAGYCGFYAVMVIIVMRIQFAFVSTEIHSHTR